MIQQKPLLNGTDLYEDDDPVTKKIPQQNLQSPQPPHTVHTLLSEIQTKLLTALIFLQESFPSRQTR